MKNVKLLFKDSNHPSNRDIISFLDQNIDKLNQVGILINFRIVTDAELPSLRQRGVTKLPILVVGGKKIYEKSPDIKNALKQLYLHDEKMKGSSGGKKFNSGDPDEQMREYMEGDLSMDAYLKDNDDDDSNSNQMDKVIQMAAQRTKDILERGNKKRERPGSKGSKSQNRDSKNKGSEESESAVERIQRTGGNMSNGMTSRDDQLMMDKFSETGINMDI